MNTLGERIKLARGATSQSSFAKLLEISKGSLGFYERNENLPNTDIVLKICSTTGVALEWLMTGVGPMRKDDEQSRAIQRALEHSFKEPATSAQGVSCAKCSELYERLYQAGERERVLLEKLAEVREENLILKNQPHTGKSIQTA